MGGIGFLCLFQSMNHSLQGGIEDNWRMAQGLQQSGFGMGRTRKKIAAMKLHGEIWIFEQVSGKNQDHCLFFLHKSLPH